MEYTIGTAVFNDWIITREIGQGATGHVYEIKKNGYEEEIRSALKVIRIPKSPSDVKAVMSEGMTEDDVTDYFKEFVDEILHEIKIMVSLKEHPNIVTYEDHCVISHEDGIGWDILIKMELLTPLQDWQMDHPMNEKEIMRLGCEISSALSYAVDHDLIHRDVKPENIFVDSFGKFKLGDFGIARTIEKTTGGLSKKGTESYMAPEVYLGKKYNAQVDIYSLGVVLYRFLNNNRLPFYPPITEKLTYSDRENALVKRIQGLPIPEPASGSTELKAVVLKACEFLPENRYASMSELHNALQNVGNPLGTIVVTPLPSKTLKPRKRWEIGIFGALILVAAFVTVIGVFHGKTKRYEVIVKDGNGSGEYKAGEEVEVVAEKTKEGQFFSKWNVPDSIEHSDETKETMKIVMPEEDVQIVAEYVDKEYKLTVENGSGSGEYKAGEKVEVSADKHAEAFYKWEIADDIEHSDATNETVEIVMPEKDIQLVATYYTDTNCEDDYNTGENTTEEEYDVNNITEYDPFDYVTLGKYKGLTIKVNPIYVTDKQVMERIASETRKNLKEGTVESGDIVNIDYVGKIDGEEFDGGSAEGYDLEIGSSTFIDGFEDGIIGMQGGETKDLELKFPEDYHSTDLAGKDVVFTVTVNSISRVPELTDEIADSISKGMTAESYKKNVRKTLEEQEKESQKSDSEQELCQMVYDNATISDFPEKSLQNTIERAKDYYEWMASTYGMSFEEYLSTYGMSQEEFLTQIQSVAEKALGEEMTLLAIAKEENIKISDEEYRDGLARYAEEQGWDDPFKVEESYGENYIKNSLLQEKVLDFLYDNANIVM